jgi:hypothetical protein
MSTYTKHTVKGRYTPTHPEKYVGDARNIIYRSSYELRFMRWCDHTPHVKKWNSEEITIPYLSPVDNKLHRYFVDFTMETVDGKTYLIEIKPRRYTQPPKPTSRKSKQFLSEVIQWETNQAKWNAATVFAKELGWEFLVLNEYDLGISK